MLDTTEGKAEQITLIHQRSRTRAGCKMLISHEHRFIFVKSRKTGGTSVEISLTPLLGPLDVVTPIGAEDEAERVLNDQYPRNFLGVEAIRPGFKIVDRETATSFAKQNGRLHAPKINFFNHMPAFEIRRAIGLSLWRKYHTFTIERIPFDRLISAHCFMTSRGAKAGMSFSDFIRQDDPRLDNGLMYRNPQGKIMVSTIIPYHNLRSGLDEVLASVGLSLENSLATAKSHYRTDRRHWSEVIDEVDRDFIAKRFARDFEVLGMTAEEAWTYGR